MRIGIITSSDTGYAGAREDVSGQVIQEIVEASGYKVVYKVLLPDENTQLSEAMKHLADQGGIDLILTTGGTGCSKRDCMPEATMAIAERMVPGIGEAIRAYSMQFTKRAMLSRGIAAIRKETLIVNLPGSPKAISECLPYILPEIEHGVEILTGKASNCARK